MTRPLLPLDFETYYENQGYTLKKLTYIEYVTHELFKIHGVGFIWNGQRYWMTDMDEFAAFLDDIGEDVELLCHNTMFDGYILHHCFNWHPKVYRDTQCMSRGMFVGQSASLDALTKRLFPNDPTKRKGKELINFAGKRDLTPEEEKALGGYCLNDVDIMLADYEVMLPHYPDREMELIDLTLQMYCDPIFEVDEALTEQTLKEKSEERQRLIKESGIAESTLSSNTKFQEWIEKQGIEPPTKISPANGEETFAGGKNDLAFQLMCRQHPKLDHVWAGRIAAKSTGEISRAERFLQVARDTGGKLPVPLHYYGAHCVPGDTEVLTPNGWVRIDTWEGGTIAQVDENQRIYFDNAARFVGPETSQWIKSSARYIPCSFTPGHTVPYLQHGSFRWTTLTAEDAAKRATLQVPVSGALQQHGEITPEQARVLVMIQADGSFCENTTRGRQLTVFVKKPRKIERARKLFAEAEVPFRELTFDSHPDYVRFVVAYRDYPTWLTPERKFFGPWVMDTTPEAREALIDELLHWDGCHNGGTTQISYSTSVYENADWISTLCHLTNRAASICIQHHACNDGYTRQPNYRVTIRNRNWAQIKNRHWESEYTYRRTYCTETKTGFWLARANGRIFVTGNTGRASGTQKMNLQNLGRGSNLRKAITAPKGKLVYVADSSNIEARMNNWNAGQLDMVEKFRTGADVYSDFAGEHIYHMPVNKHDNPLERFVGKVAVLGLGYGMGAGKFRETLAVGAMGPQVFIDDQEAFGVVNAYRKAHYMIQRYWQTGDLMLAKMLDPKCDEQWGVLHVFHNMIVLPNGMALQYPGLRAHEDPRNGSLSFEYWNGKYWKNIWGGSLCISEHTPVLTDRGPVRIQDIRSADKVWDGVEWVNHHGLIDKGTAQTIKAHGVWMTPEHEVLTDHGWKPAAESTQYRRAHCELPEGIELPLRPEAQSRLEHSMPGLQSRVSDARHRVQQTLQETGTQLLRLYAKAIPERAANYSRHEPTSGVRRLAQYAGSLPTAFTSSVQKLRRQGHNSLRPLAAVRGLLGRYGGILPTRFNPGPQGQRWALSAGQLPMGRLSNPGQQPAQQQNRQWKIVGSDFAGNRYRSDYTTLPARPQLAGGQTVGQTQRHQQVYDLLNCGPRNRFTVLDENGQPLIVHNCENIIQSLSRIVLFDQMLDINAFTKELDPTGRVCLNVHDEIITVASDFGARKSPDGHWVNTSEADEYYAGIEKILRTPLDWCPDLPLDCEGGFALEYSK